MYPLIPNFNYSLLCQLFEVHRLASSTSKLIIPQNNFSRSFPFKSCTLPLFAAEHRILVALSAISAIQSCNISHQQVLVSAEELFSSCSAGRLPISWNKVCTLSVSIIDSTCGA